MHALGLPFWFLVLSLFLPRISLLVLYLGAHPGGAYVISLVPLLAAVLVPRLLILFMIYTAQGLSVWFLVHAVALLLTWGGIGRSQYRRRYRDDY